MRLRSVSSGAGIPSFLAAAADSGMPFFSDTPPEPAFFFVFFAAASASLSLYSSAESSESDSESLSASLESDE